MRTTSWKMAVALLPLGCLLLCSCMTIFTSHETNILINRDTTEPVTIMTATDTLTADGQPLMVKVKKKHLNRPIRLTSEHHDYETLIPGRRVDWVGAYFDLYTYGIGLIVDANNGTLYHPRRTTYYVHSFPEDSLPDAVPVKDYRQPSAFTPRPDSHRLLHHELRLSVNFANFMDNRSFDRMYDRVCREQELEPYNGFYCGIGYTINVAASLSYFYHINHRWAIGLVAGTGQRAPADELGYPIKEQDNYLQEYCGGMYATSWFFLPAAKCHWAFFNSTRLYTKAAVGVINQHNWFSSDLPTPLARQYNERRWHPAYQFSVFGIEVSQNHWRGFGELGFGMEGVLNMGISYYF